MSQICVNPWAAMLLATVVGCSPSQRLCPSKQTASVETQPPAATAPIPEADADRIRAALLSVHWHAIDPHADEAPEPIRPIPETQAARILAGAQGPMAESRRRTAITVLAADDVDRHREALVILGAPIPEIIEALKMIGRLRVEREKVVRALLEKSGVAITDCIQTGAITEIVVSPSSLEAECTQRRSPGTDNTDVTLATSKLEVTTSLTTLARAIDPQSWDVCMPLYFRKTHVAKLVNGAPVLDANHDAEAVTNPPAPGSTWKDQLFEHFEIDWRFGIPAPPSYSSFRNLLYIDSAPGNGSHRVTYCLDASIWSSVPLLPPFAGGIDIDDGHLAVSPAASAGRLSIEVVKFIRFAGWPAFPIDYNKWFNQMSAAMLRAMGGELEGLVCCNPPVAETPLPPILIP